MSAKEDFAIAGIYDTYSGMCSGTFSHNVEYFCQNGLLLKFCYVGQIPVILGFIKWVSSVMV